MIIQASNSTGPLTGWPIDNNDGMIPEESSLAVCLGAKESIGVERSKYANPNETEKIDIIRFLFGRIIDGKQYFAQTREFRQSGNPKSALMAFLTSWLGKMPPADGTFNTDDLIGQGGQITISHQTSAKGTKYPAIVGISPVLADLKDKVVDAGEFTIPGDSPEYKQPTGGDSVPY